MAAGNSEYPFGWGIQHMMAADELLNGAPAMPAYAGALPAGPSAPATAVATSTGNAAMGMPGLLVWGILLVALVLSHTFTFELQE